MGGTGITKDLAWSFKFFTMAAEKGDLRATARLKGLAALAAAGPISLSLVLPPESWGMSIVSGFVTMSALAIARTQDPG